MFNSFPIQEFTTVKTVETIAHIQKVILTVFFLFKGSFYNEFMPKKKSVLNHADTKKILLKTEDLED